MEKETLVDAFQREAEQLLSEGRVVDVEFAGRTYQIQVLDPSGDEYWPFLQFGHQEELQDALCTCETAEATGACVHLAAALLRLYQGKHDPLHIRFGQSVWNKLCSLFGQRQGYAATILEKAEPGHYSLQSVTGKQLFSVQARQPAAKARLEALIDRRVMETEENSLKFSGLSSEELMLWREGRPSPGLQYELSFWSDLAKWLFLLQDGNAPYTVDFEYDPSGLPNALLVWFDDLSVRFYLSQANLPLIIPALSTVSSPLTVYHVQEEVLRNLTYDRATGSFHVGSLESAHQKRRLQKQNWHQAHAAEHLIVDGWLFAPGDGFYATSDDGFIEEPVIPKEQVDGFLDAHAALVSRHLVGEAVHRQKKVLHYELWFDPKWELRVRAYLFDPGDLQSGTSRLFGRWAYIEDDGFHPLFPSAFDQSELSIPEHLVSDFVHRYRLFLSECPGFRTHLAAVEASLIYEVDESGGLSFASGLELAERDGDGHDFGDWVYLAGQGFFSKRGKKPREAVRAGVHIPGNEVPLFIRTNYEELELIPGFFSAKCPVSDVTLGVELMSASQVRIWPEYELQPEYRKRSVRFFGEYVYVAGEGFSGIPRHLLPPERFRAEQVLSGQELHLFLTYELDTLLPRISKLDGRLRRPAQLELVVSDAESPQEMRGIMALDMAYQSRQGSVPLSQLWRAQSQRQRYLFSTAGLIDLDEPRFQWLRTINPARFDRKRNVLRLSTLELIRLQAVEKLRCASDAPRTTALLEALTTFQVTERPVMEGFHSELRHYQMVGVEWLWFLHSQGLSGLLCDDMGLGKTHQAMGLMAAVTHLFSSSASEEQPHYLVVCPTSVLYHWKEKLEQFLPSIRVHLFHGTGRVLEELHTYDLLLTSYGILRSELARLGQITFELAIFDEIQVAKNRSSRTHQALAQLRAHMRLGLTGTPIENNLRELKSLFDLVLPGYLPPETVFREQFEIPIEKDGSAEQRQLLRRIVRPFILRRRKEEVLTELPEKTEERAHCELSAQQRHLYTQVLQRAREALLPDLTNPDKVIAYMHIFSILTALKRICDHPAVYLKEPQNYQQHESGKWALFCELLGQARDSGQKVVVFSQYLDMLDIIELHLKQSGIGYAAIRGATADRQKQLKRFAEDSRCEVFVGSLGAAGLGIDLTAASVVIHYDRWWTKARENQATDRVYRIGQTRGVQVFKLLTMGTVEDSIDTIIERKGALMEEVVGTDDANQLKSFTREELIALFSLTG